MSRTARQAAAHARRTWPKRSRRLNEKRGRYQATSEPAREILGVETIDVVSDRGHFKIEEIEACERADCVLHVAKPQRGSSVRDGLFRKDEFRYDAGLDAYVCRPRSC